MNIAEQIRLKLKLKEITTETTTVTTETILNMISNNPKITTREIASACGITEDGVAYHIKKLKQSGRITRVGGARYGGEWKVN
ncbi:MAG: winged helix-turn-helix domain-containing protein [Prevotellaceae bacterium]|nr:winged helix-turn-helix domain-containing protein [Prevotellaceae bacterium]